MGTLKNRVQFFEKFVDRSDNEVNGSSAISMRQKQTAAGVFRISHRPLNGTELDMLQSKSSPTLKKINVS